MRSGVIDSIVLFGVILLLYSLTQTWGYWGDGITYAFNIEHVYQSGKSFPRLVHQNHLLYSVLGYYAYVAARALGFSIRSIQILQGGSILFGALGVVAFHRLALSYVRSRSIALLGASVLAVLAGWWKTSTDADVYVVSASLVVVSVAVVAVTARLWPIAAAVMALAMVTHQLAALSLLAPAYVVFMRIDGSNRRRTGQVAMFCLATSGITIGAYAVVAICAGKAKGAAGVIDWVVSNQGGFEMVFEPARNFATALLSNVRMVVSSDLKMFELTAGGVDYAALGASGLCLVVFVVAGIRLVAACRPLAIGGLPRDTLIVCLLWTVPYLAFLLVWEPYLTYYRVFYAPALILLLAGMGDAVLSSVRGRGILAMGCSLVCGLLCANFALYIHPNMDIRANPLVFQAITELPDWRDGGVVLGLGPNEADTTAMYFNPAMRWKTLRVSGTSIESQCDRILSDGTRVWLNAGAIAVASDQLRDRFRGGAVVVSDPRHIAKFVEVLPAHTVP